MAQVEPKPNPTPLSTQQEAAQLGITLQELTKISKQAIRKQAKWLTMDKTEWRKCEDKRWQGEVRADGENREPENQERMEEATWQEQHGYETTQTHTTITCPRSTPPPLIHPESATAQLRLTPEEAKEVHKECIHAQGELQREMQWEDREQEAKQHTYPPLPEHLTYDATSNHSTHVVSLGQRSLLSPMYSVPVCADWPGANLVWTPM
jgi:hypothetical protein